MGRKVDCSFLYIGKITHKNWDYEFVLVTKEQFLVYSMVYQEKNKTEKQCQMEEEKGYIFFLGLEGEEREIQSGPRQLS